MSVTLEEQKNIERILADNFDRFVNYANNTFVKKEEFAHLEEEQIKIKIDIEVIKQTMATKTDIAEMKMGFITWMIGLTLGNTALIFTILKTFSKI